MIPEKVLEYISHTNAPVLWAATDPIQDIHFDKNAPVSEFDHVEKTILIKHYRL